MTANIVIASANRLMDVRHFCLNRNKIAEISVPAWPIPTQNTKFTIAQPQPTGLFSPHTPVPSQINHPSDPKSTNKPETAAAKRSHHSLGARFSTIELTFSVMEPKVCPPVIRGAFSGSKGCGFNASLT